MLRRAYRPVPAFDLVVCADFERLSRKAWRQILIEDTFRACGVAVASADEGPLPPGGHSPLSVVLGLDSPTMHNGAG